MHTLLTQPLLTVYYQLIKYFLSVKSLTNSEPLISVNMPKASDTVGPNKMRHINESSAPPIKASTIRLGTLE